jgi:tetratricopeptide (TPR) repeat protein
MWVGFMWGMKRRYEKLDFTDSRMGQSVSLDENKVVGSVDRGDEEEGKEYHTISDPMTDVNMIVIEEARNQLLSGNGDFYRGRFKEAYVKYKQCIGSLMVPQRQSDEIDNVAILRFTRDIKELARQTLSRGLKIYQNADDLKDAGSSIDSGGGSGKESSAGVRAGPSISTDVSSDADSVADTTMYNLKSMIKYLEMRIKRRKSTGPAKLFVDNPTADERNGDDDDDDDDDSLDEKLLSEIRNMCALGDTVGDAVNNCGGCKFISGDLHTALKLYEDALQLRYVIEGEESLASAESLQNMATCSEGLEDLAGAESGLLKALFIEKKLGLEKSTEGTSTMNNLGVLYSHMRRNIEAFELLSKVVDYRTTTLGAKHRLTLNAQGNLIIVQSQMQAKNGRAAIESKEEPSAPLNMRDVTTSYPQECLKEGGGGGGGGGGEGEYGKEKGLISALFS